MITKNLFNKLFPTAGLNKRKYNLVQRRDELIAAMNKLLPLYAINSYLRICAFWSCCGIETDYFKTTEEYASGAAYDTRTDLGNTPADDGDGEKYKGSSLIQTTGLYNFWRVTVRFVKKKTGKDWSKDEKKYVNFRAYTRSKDYEKFLVEADRLDVNFIKHPERLRDDIEIAVEAACIFWEENNLNTFADKKRIKALNGVVNRGDAEKTPLHWDKRNELYSKCLRAVPVNFSFEQPVMLASNEGENSATPSAVENSPKALAVPITTATVEPAENAPEAEDPSKIKASFDKYIKHCKTDSAKNIFLVIAARIWASVVAMWTIGIFGKVFLIIIGLVIVGSLIYALVYYRKRFFAWISAGFDSIFES